MSADAMFFRLTPYRPWTWYRHGILSIATLLTILTGCAAVPVPQEMAGRAHGVLIPGVPFHPQKAFQCGPASLSAVLNHFGDPIDPESIAREVSASEHRGMLTLDMMLYAQSRGFEARSGPADEKALRDSIDYGRPAIALVDLGIGPVRRPHFLVVVGYDGQEVIVNSGQTRHQKISWGRFLGQWDRAGRWALFLSPGK